MDLQAMMETAIREAEEKYPAGELVRRETYNQRGLRTNLMATFIINELKREGWIDSRQSR